MKAVRHFGIVVSDLEEALHFYQDLLGLRVSRRIEESGEYLSSITGLKNASATTVKFAADDGNLVELLYFSSHPRTAAGHKEMCEIGASHVSFTVEDVDAEYSRLSKGGILFNSPPQFSPDGYAKVAFCRDFDGTLIELVQELQRYGSPRMRKDYLSVVYNEQRTPKTEYPAQLARYLANRFGLRKGDSLLEIGCGRGDFLKAFQEIGLRCSGVDVEEKSAELLKEVDVKVCDLSKERLPFGDESFDVIYHKSLIEHLYDPSNLMSETYRVLKKGGKVMILTPEWVSQMRNFYEDITHRRPYDVMALTDTLTMFGFKEVSAEKFNQLPVLWKIKPLRIISGLLRVVLNVHAARFLTEKTRIKFFRWSVELMVLGYGVK